MKCVVRNPDRRSRSVLDGEAGTFRTVGGDGPAQLSAQRGQSAVLRWPCMMSGKPALLGRHDECELLDRLVERARGGWSAVLVLRGEPGVGKTALLERAIAAAAGLRVVRVTGVESEMELAYAALQQLCLPMLGQLEALPGPQHDALATAFGLAAGNAPDPFMVGLAALGLLSEAARRQPVLCAVDDAQWLDQASARALAFVARRLQADAVAMLFATREDHGSLSGLPGLLVHGLADSDARALLTSVPGVCSIDKRVRDQLIAEAGGNPLALLELADGVTPTALAGGFGLPGAPGLQGRLERSFLRRCQALPASTRQLLLVAAADPTGDPVLVWNAAARLGIRSGTAIPRRPAGLSRLARGWSSGTRLCGQWCTRLLHRQSGGQYTKRWPMPPTATPSQPGGPGTGPRQRRDQRNRSRQNSSARRTTPVRAEASRQRRRSGNARPR